MIRKELWEQLRVQINLQLKEDDNLTGVKMDYIIKEFQSGNVNLLKYTIKQ